MTNLENLKARLADVPGIESLTMELLAGRQWYGLNGKVISIDPLSTEDEAETAIRNALWSPIAQLVSRTPAPNNSAALLPKVAPPSTRSNPMTTPPAAGGFAASLKALMNEARAGLEQARADGQAKVKDAVGKLNEAKDATAKVAGSVAKTIEDEAASVMSELGQISNDL